jgi:hypothetical protein
MDIFCKNVELFLNNLDIHIIQLINPTFKSFLEQPSTFNDLNNIILYGNDKKYADSYFLTYLKNLYQVNKIKLNNGIYNYINHSNISSEIVYKYSDYHFEFDYSDKHIQFIKSIVKNKCISNRQVVFYMRNIDNVHRIHQSALTRLMEQYQNVKFIITTKNISKVNISILSRAIKINISFPIERVRIFMNTFLKTEYDIITFEDLYKKSDNNIIIYISNHDNGYTQTKLVKFLYNLLDSIVKDRNHLNVVMKIREFCYKLYHLNIPFNYISKKVIEHYTHTKYIIDIISISAHCDYMTCIGSKQILVYEKYFLKIFKIIKGF